MDKILEFALPGAAMALVFYVAVMCGPWRQALIKYHYATDVIFTGTMMYLLAGTFSGLMTGALGGLMLSAILLITNWFIIPKEIPSESLAYYT